MDDLASAIEEPQVSLKLTLQRRNAALRNRRTELGLTQKQVADRAGIHLGSYNIIENLKHQPTARVERAICAALMETEELLFPPELAPLYKIKLKSLEKDIPVQVFLDQVPEWEMMVEADQEELVGALELREAIADQVCALEKIKPRAAEVLRLYFGLPEQPGGKYTEALTLEEIAKQLTMSRARVGQIKEKALSYLRRPNQSFLSEFL